MILNGDKIFDNATRKMIMKDESDFSNFVIDHSALLIIRSFKNIFADDGRDKCFNVGYSNEGKYGVAIFFYIVRDSVNKAENNYKMSNERNIYTIA